MPSYVGSTITLHRFRMLTIKLLIRLINNLKCLGQPHGKLPLHISIHNTLKHFQHTIVNIFLPISLNIYTASKVKHH